MCQGDISASIRILIQNSEADSILTALVVINLKDYKTEIKKRRDFLKAHDFDVIPIEEWWDPDSMKGVPQPPLQKPYDSDAGLISLVDPKDFSIGLYSVIDAFIIFMWREYVLYCHRID